MVNKFTSGGLRASAFRIPQARYGRGTSQTSLLGPSTFGHLPCEQLLYSFTYPSPGGMDGHRGIQRIGEASPIVRREGGGPPGRIEGVPHRVRPGPARRERRPRRENRAGIHSPSGRRLDRAVRPRPPAARCGRTDGEAPLDGGPGGPRARWDLGALPEEFPPASVRLGVMVNKLAKVLRADGMVLLDGRGARHGKLVYHVLPGRPHRPINEKRRVREQVQDVERRAGPLFGPTD